MVPRVGSSAVEHSVYTRAVGGSKPSRRTPPVRARPDSSSMRALSSAPHDRLTPPHESFLRPPGPVAPTRGNLMKKLLPTTLLGVAGLTVIGLIGTTSPIVASTSDEAAKRDDDAPSLVLVADDDDDDTNDDDTRSRTG